MVKRQSGSKKRCGGRDSAMRVLLVEPDYRSTRDRPRTQSGDAAWSKPSDETLWYPPLGLMKIARFHKDRGDVVQFVRGCSSGAFARGDLFRPEEIWDRVYITTVFTYHFEIVVKTVQFYLDAVSGDRSRLFVGGMMATLMGKEIEKETGVRPIVGVLNSPHQIGLRGTSNIDLLPADYDLVDDTLYAVNDTFYAYTTRGCTNKCPWCAVPRIEPSYVPYIDIKPTLGALRKAYGDKARLKLMDNNVLVSPQLGKIVDDLLALGYGRGEHTDARPRKQRVIDFNQGLDASHLTEEKMRLLSSLNIRPMRIAFDRAKEKRTYLRALRLARKYGVDLFSNYMLYNFEDTPKGLYERLRVNIELNEEWVADHAGARSGKIYSYPMRFAPIHNTNGERENRSREAQNGSGERSRAWLTEPAWTKRFTRNVAVMTGAAHGAISPTPSLAWRTIGHTFEEFLTNLYMPEELLRNRSKHEKRVYPGERKHRRGTGKVETFRSFVLRLLRRQDARFWKFHEAVSQNSAKAIRACLKKRPDSEMRKWLRLYLKKR